MPKLIDLRSDTVTAPTPAMRAAMAEAVVGDDVLGEDPTVRLLEETVADLLGKEAGLFTTSGTMSNQIAVMCLCQRGDEVIVPETSHIFNLEVGGLAALSGVQVRPLSAPGGVYDPEALARAIRTAAIQTAPTTLVCTENSADLNRGFAVSTDQLSPVVRVCREHGLPIYLDGARIFNSAAALGVPAKTLAEPAVAVAVCLCKGLAAPVGSILAGDREFIATARRMRQRVGGGWRQAGVIAAAGLVAVTTMLERLTEDHQLARDLAAGLMELGIAVDPSPVHTNILTLDLSARRLSSQPFADAMKAAGVLVKPVGPMAVRMVTHKDVGKAELDPVLTAVRDVWSASTG
ncbi:MAG: GntG family PLP-dependent aldolase [Bacillota bacterium]